MNLHTTRVQRWKRASIVPPEGWASPSPPDLLCGDAEAGTAQRGRIAVAMTLDEYKD